MGEEYMEVDGEKYDIVEFVFDMSSFEAEADIAYSSKNEV